MNIFNKPSLQLIAPTLVRLIKPTEIQFAKYEVGDVVALEKKAAIDLVRAGGAENAPAGSEAKNPFVVVDEKGKAVPASKVEDPVPASAADLKAAEKADADAGANKTTK